VPIPERAVPPRKRSIALGKEALRGDRLRKVPRYARSGRGPSAPTLVWTTWDLPTPTGPRAELDPCRGGSSREDIFRTIGNGVQRHRPWPSFLDRAPTRATKWAITEFSFVSLSGSNGPGYTTSSSPSTSRMRDRSGEGVRELRIRSPWLAFRSSGDHEPGTLVPSPRRASPFRRFTKPTPSALPRSRHT